MIYHCADCDAPVIIEYDVKVTKACQRCGSWRFWFTHLGYHNLTHEVLIDCQTGKKLSPDPCDRIGEIDTV